MSPPAPWIVVLIKDFSTAKHRLAPFLSPPERHALARVNASRALDAALAVAPTLAVCGSAEATTLASARGAEVITESVAHGQNTAATLGLTAVVAYGGLSALVLSSDLPLVDEPSIRRLLERASDTADAVVVAAPALGRQGTNALYLRPVSSFTPQFGDGSFSRFEHEAARRGRRFIAHEDVRLALDLDEPSDITVWEQLRVSA